jgi:phosphoribosylglycinamide formyltransferase-1
MKKNKIAIFASGSGTNAENIGRFFSDHPLAEVSLILTNKKDAGVISRAENLGIPCIVFNREDFYDTGKVISYLRQYSIDFIVLAGFLWLIPKNLIENYPKQIINIHPALLPKYGGKGMYGSFVHETVIKNKDTESGITIHFVNEEYDAGSVIFQARCSFLKNETAETLAEKVHALEYEFYPKVIERLLGSG